MKRIQFPDSMLNQLQQNTEDAINQATAQPFMNGNLIEGVKVTSAGAQIAHKLGRQAKGYFVVRNSSGAAVKDTNMDDKFVNLTSLSDTTLSLWVF